MRRKVLPLSVLCVAMAVLSPAAWAYDALDLVRVRRGIVAIVGDKGCRQALTLARGSELTVFVQLTTHDQVAEARRIADEAGLYGTRIYVEQGPDGRIGLADNMADAVWVLGGAAVPEAEVLRVMRPGGWGRLEKAKKTLAKPFPQGAGQWSHHYHGPDNNPQCDDRLAKAPYLTQFAVAPRYAPAPQAAVAAGGRLFMAFGHVAWHKREEPMLDKLVAMNGFNGTILWTRPLTSGIMVDRGTIIATPETLYLADEKSCKLIDAATGKVTGEIAPPAELTGGTFWKWMALSDGVLYALIGKAEPADKVARWRATQHGWRWNKISEGYGRTDDHWGFAQTLLAMNPKTGKILWRHTEPTRIDSRSLCTKAGRIFFGSFGKYLACLDARTGKPLWRRTVAKDASLFEAIGPYRAGQGYVAGWKTAAYLKCTDQALYFVGPQVHHLTAVAAKDGSLMWTHRQRDVQVVIRDDGVYTIAPQRGKGLSHKLDPATGKILASYEIRRRACARSTGSPDGILFRTHGGSVRLDLATGQSHWISSMRPSCHVGVVIAHGQLYWLPWACDCNNQIFGTISCAPAGDFRFGATADASDRLQRLGKGARVAEFRVSPADWPTYRANNTRTAVTAASVPANPKLLWRVKPEIAFEPTAPVAAGGLVLLGGSDGVVRALDAADGKLRWKAYTGGALRFPPAIADGRALVGSGDGWAYAFEAATGRELWRFRAAPQARRINVFGKLLSTWPVASGVVVESGVAYLAAGINNFDGTHVYALDAATGQIKWQNNTSGHLDAFSRRGVAVQGETMVHKGKLFLAAGNAVGVAMYDLATGKCYNNPPSGKGSRGRRGRELQLANDRVKAVGQPFYSDPASPVYSGEVRWPQQRIRTANAVLSLVQTPDGWKLVAKAAPDGKPMWSYPLGGEPVRWGVAVDAAGRIVVVLTDGQVICLGTK